MGVRERVRSPAKIFITTREVGAGYLGPNWEGPYKVTKILPKKAYKLKDMAGRPLSPRECWAPKAVLSVNGLLFMSSLLNPQSWY